MNLGDIPIGVKNLEIHLTSTSDVDIQLYDKNNGNRAIVKWYSAESLKSEDKVCDQTRVRACTRHFAHENTRSQK